MSRFARRWRAAGLRRRRRQDLLDSVQRVLLASQSPEVCPESPHCGVPLMKIRGPAFAFGSMAEGLGLKDGDFLPGMEKLYCVACGHVDISKL